MTRRVFARSVLPGGRHQEHVVLCYVGTAVERAASAVRRMKLRSAAFSFLPQAFMYLLSLDDAGSPGNPVEEYFVLGGVCVYEAQVDWFSRELDKLAVPYHKNPEDIEFHASTIFRGARPRGRRSRSMRRGEIGRASCRERVLTGV